MPVKIKTKTFYSVPELSKKLNVTTFTIRDYIKRGKLKGKKTMGKWFISDEGITEFSEELKNV